MWIARCEECGYENRQDSRLEKCPDCGSPETSLGYESSVTEVPTITSRGVEFSIGDELLYQGEFEATIVGFSLSFRGEGSPLPTDGDSYWLIVRTENGERRWLAGSIAESIPEDGGYDLRQQDE